MTNIERAKKVAEIESKLNPIGQRKIILETKLKLLKEEFLMSFREETRNEISITQNEYDITIAQFNSLYLELRSYQKKYVVQYTAELTEVNINSSYNSQYVEELYLRTDCNIDTFSNSWQHYMTNSDAIEVIKEVYSFIFKCRFSKFTIDNIKSL